MPEILENFEILMRRNIDLDTLSLGGVAYGSDVSEFPFERISEITLAKIVESTSYSDIAGYSYYDENDQELEKSEVIDSVIEDGGVFHFSEKIGFFINEGKVNGFSIYGGHEGFFRHLSNFEIFIQEFGNPDELKTTMAYGNGFTKKCLYRGCKKLIVWNVASQEIVCFVLGDITDTL